MADNTSTLPGLNYNAPISTDDFKHLEYVYSSTFNEILKIIFGNYTEENRYGIVTDTNPQNVTNNEENPKPLQVDWFNEGSTTSTEGGILNIHPGMAITEKGNIIYNSDITAIDILQGKTLSLGDNKYIIYAEYSIIDDPETKTVTKYGTVASKRKTLENPIKYATWENWNNSSIFTTDRLQDIIPLALASFTYSDVTTSGTLTSILMISKSIDQTDSILNNNRPWFSLIDTEHRNQLGTGSPDTPHHLGLNDLGQGNNTLYEQLNNICVYSKDIDLRNCPGTLCYEDISIASLSQDTTGNLTGVPGAKYVELNKFPNKILGVVGGNHSGYTDNNDIAVEHLEGTNIIVLAKDEEWETIPVRIFYTYTQAGSFNVENLNGSSTILQIKQPLSEELIISNGTGISSLETNKLDFSGHTLYPQKFKIYVNEENELLKSPQSLVCNTKITDAGTTTQTNDNNIYTPSKLKVGVFSKDTFFDFSLNLKGIDQDGNTIQELINITYLGIPNDTVKPKGAGGVWSPISPISASTPIYNIGKIDSPVYEHDSTSGTTYTSNDLVGELSSSISAEFGNFVKTYNKFQELTSWTLSGSISSLTKTYIEISADLDPVNSETMRNLIYLGDILWNGQAIVNGYDRRFITSKLSKNNYTNYVMGGSLSTNVLNNITHTLTGTGGIPNVEYYNYKVLLQEYLEDPYYIDINKSKINKNYKSNLIPNIYTYPENIYTSRAIELSDNNCTYSSSQPNFQEANIVILKKERQNSQLYNKINGSISGNNYGAVRVYTRKAEDAAPYTWTNWTEENIVTATNMLTNELVYTADILEPSTSVNTIIKYQVKILGDFTRFYVVGLN